jgi:hypothetical protein
MKANAIIVLLCCGLFIVGCQTRQYDPNYWNGPAPTQAPADSAGLDALGAAGGDVTLWQAGLNTANALIDDLKTKTAEQQAVIAELEAEGKDQSAAQTFLAELRDDLDDLKQSVGVAEGLTTHDGQPDINAAAQTAAGLLPPPWNAVAGLLVGLFGGVIGENKRNAKVRTAFGQLVRAIDKAKKRNAKLNEAFDEATPEITGRIDPKAQELIDRQRRKG